MRAKRSTYSACAGLIAGLLAGVGLAWACTPTSTVTLLPETGPAAMKVNLTGQVAPDARDGSPVEILWNSPSGRVLAAVAPDARGNFAAEVAIPEASPGVYYLLAVSGQTEAGRAAFEVTSPGDDGGASSSAGRTVSSDTWSGLSESNAALAHAFEPARYPQERSSSRTLGVGAVLMALGVSALVVGLAMGSRERSRVRLKA